jgi:hypothetical protein
MAWTFPAQSEILKTPVFTGIFIYFPCFFAIDDASFEAMFPMLLSLGPTRCEAVARGQVAAC